MTHALAGRNMTSPYWHTVLCTKIKFNHIVGTVTASEETGTGGTVDTYYDDVSTK